jgi:imidazolonepropionase-like amidohydrolase
MMARLTWIAVLAALFATSATVGATAGDLAIVHARIYASPGTPAIEDGSVIVRNGRITAVGPAARIRLNPGAEVIDGHGLVVVAGFWNSHVHLFGPAFVKSAAPAAASGQLERMFTRWGFTTVFDIASLPGDAIALRKRIAAGEVSGPNILTVDAPFYPNNGVPGYAKALLVGVPSFETGTPEQAAARARRQLAAGADGVKIFAGSAVGGKIGVLPMPLDAARAVVDEAHRIGKPAFAHPSNLEGLNVAIASGVDVLAHTTPDGGPWPADMAARLKARHMALIPTLTLWGVELKKGNASQAEIDRFTGVAQVQLKTFSDAGGQILFGTDVGYTDAVDTTPEYRLMSGAGLSWSQILASLTTSPAQRFKAPRKGRIAPGMDGDLTLLSADPARDVGAFAQVAYTIRGGQILYRSKP